MTEKVKDSTSDEIKQAPPLDFDVLDPEKWVRIRIKDGTELKVKSDIIGVKRLLRKTPDGYYTYAVQCRTTVRVSFEDPLQFNK